MISPEIDLPCSFTPPYCVWSIKSDASDLAASFLPNVRSEPSSRCLLLDRLIFSHVQGIL
jgi:hypothetical protein